MEKSIEAQATENKADVSNTAPASRAFSYGSFILIILFGFVSWIYFLGPIGSKYEPAYKTLEPAMQGKPDWFVDLSREVLNHERSIVGDEAHSVWVPTEKLYRQKKWDEPELFAVPARWLVAVTRLVAVTNTSALKPEELDQLVKITQNSDYLTTTMAAQWLLGVAERLDKEADAQSIRDQKAVILQQKSVAEELQKQTEPSTTTQQ